MGIAKKIKEMSSPGRSNNGGIEAVDKLGAPSLHDNPTLSQQSRGVIEKIFFITPLDCCDSVGLSY